MRIVIAGGIGSGKSVVTRILRELGAKVVVADEINAELLLDPSYIDLIEHNFPDVVHNKVIDKRALAEVVYHDERQRRVLMDLAHPRIFERMFSMYPEEKVVFYEIPLLSETKAHFDQVWYVYSDPDVRASRIVSRDGVTKEYANRLILLQRGEDLLCEKADIVIENNADADSLCEKVKGLYYSILDQLSL